VRPRFPAPRHVLHRPPASSVARHSSSPAVVPLVLAPVRPAQPCAPRSSSASPSTCTSTPSCASSSSPRGPSPSASSSRPSSTGSIRCARLPSPLPHARTSSRRRPLDPCVSPPATLLLCSRRAAVDGPADIRDHGVRQHPQAAHEPSRPGAPSPFSSSPTPHVKLVFFPDATSTHAPVLRSFPRPSPSTTLVMLSLLYL